MTRRWRLISGQKLYDIRADPGQKRDVAAQYSDVVRRLRDAHERWWEEISKRLDEYSPVSIGSDEENPTRLDAFDVMGDVAWHQRHITMAQKSTGKWRVKVEKEGEYRFSLRRWPEELHLPIDAAISQEEADRIAPYQSVKECRTISPVRARLRIVDREENINVEKGNSEATFSLHLQHTGITNLEAWFIDKEGETQGAYYVYVKRM